MKTTGSRCLSLPQSSGESASASSDLANSDLTSSDWSFKLYADLLACIAAWCSGAAAWMPSSSITLPSFTMSQCNLRAYLFPRCWIDVMCAMLCFLHTLQRAGSKLSAMRYNERSRIQSQLNSSSAYRLQPTPEFMPERHVAHGAFSTTPTAHGAFPSRTLLNTMTSMGAKYCILARIRVYLSQDGGVH